MELCLICKKKNGRPSIKGIPFIIQREYNHINESEKKNVSRVIICMNFFLNVQINVL